jgi:hypothetical protein
LAHDENPETLYADPVKMLPIVVKALQELAAHNESLETRLAALEAKLNIS